jgi:hypothetical protein
MTSRERLLMAISGRQADRVPVNCYELNAYDPDSWYNKQDSYKPLMALIRQKTDCIYPGSLPVSPFGNAAYAVTDADAGPEKSDGFIKKKKWREGISSFTRTTYNTPRGPLETLHRTDDNVHTVWTMEHLLKDIDDIDKYISIPIVPPGEFNLSDFAAKQKALADNGIMTVTVSDPICEVAEFFEMGQFLVFAMTETRKIKSFMDYIHEHQMAYLKAVLSQCGRFGINLSEVLFRICGPEYASEPYLPPRYFPDFVTRYVTAMTELIHSFGGKVRFHCHGRIAAILDEIARSGPDAIDPVEPPPDGDVELSQVKKRLGDRMCLFGNIEVKLLEYGSHDEVRDFVINAMAQAKAGGGYVIMPTASPIGAPLSSKTIDNYATFIETALKFGQY